MLRNYVWATQVTIYKNSKLLDVDLPAQNDSETEEIAIIEGVNIRIFPQKNSIMGPKDEFIECSTLLLCSNYQCDVDVFTAVNESGLVYDGGVVVNEVYLFFIYYFINSNFNFIQFYIYIYFNFVFFTKEFSNS